jgi:hypothetical protein
MTNIRDEPMGARTDRDHGLLVYGGFALPLAVVIAICEPWNLTDQSVS